MTLQRFGSGSGSLVPQTGTDTVEGRQGDLVGEQVVPLQRALPGSKFEFIQSEQDRSVVAWRWTIFDWRGGLNMQLGEVGDAHTRLASSTGVSQVQGYAHPPFLTTLQNTITTTTPDTQFWANHLNRLFLTTTGGAGALAASKLLGETSSTNPVLIDTTYAPAGAGFISGLWAPVYLGNSATPNMVVGLSTAADVLSVMGSPPTSIGQMEAATAGLTGFIQLALPGQPYLAQAGASMLYGLGSGALGQNAQVMQNPITPGWQAIASFQWAGRKARVYWRKPVGISTVQTMLGASPGVWELVSTNPYGTDTQYHDLGLTNITGIGIVRDGFVATDDDRIIFHNGRPEELGWKSDRTHVTSQTYKTRGLRIIDKRELIAEVNLYGAAATTLRFWERYDWDLKAWQAISAQTAITDGASTTGLLSSRGSPLMPFSPSTRNLHAAGGSGVTTAYFSRKFVESPGVNPREYQTLQSYEASCLFVTPGVLFPAPITYAPKVVTHVFCGADTTGGGNTLPTPGAVQVQVVEYKATSGGVGGVWKSTISKTGRMRPLPQNQSRLLTPQVRVSVTQGTDPTLVPNCLPITIEGLAFLPKRAKRGWLPW